MTDDRDWIEHRRGDGELLGWMRRSGEGFVVVDLLGVKDTPGRVAAIAVSALAFALYHSDLSVFAFFLLAGLFFGAVYVWRGFGVVVATHVMYDMDALLAAPPGG